MSLAFTAMSLAFPHPPHLAQYPHAPNPHNVPVFDESRLAPVLYLPPLLSSLPETFPSTPVPPENPPLITQTRLPDIDPASLSLHKALHHFRPRSADYASMPYSEAFNWDQLALPEHEERDWYCVVFRSKRKPGSDGGSLYDADKKAHEEAVHNGGVCTPHVSFQARKVTNWRSFSYTGTGYRARSPV
ncbi:hypothetical protein B0H10DRAFT_2002676 [Mycena sp. CBHHK59/15]|nr:hypothetical protein B0H10DRAFT_2002676 [Mycena sp. CBHHK59/15]